MAARSRVFGIPELLEMILLHLPLLDLLRANEVCVSWKDQYNKSVKIQQALFLEPYSDLLLKVEHKSKRPRNARNAEVDWGWQTDAGDQLALPPLLHPFLNIWTSKHGGKAALLHSPLVAPVDPYWMDMRERAGDEIVALHRRSASLHKMLPMQPPPRFITKRCLEWSLGADEAEDVVVRGKKGGLPRIGDIVQAFGSHWIFCPNCPLWPDEDNRWDFHGDHDLDKVDEGVTGWEMLWELERRAKVV